MKKKIYIKSLVIVLVLSIILVFIVNTSKSEFAQVEQYNITSTGTYNQSSRQVVLQEQASTSVPGTFQYSIYNGTNTPFGTSYNGYFNGVL